ncbi:MAG TPA: hypothetical protein VJ804_01500 [Acidimicrobiales bacterium]|nr:hypothetical protein [Acidimicrobiales bacterium]
MADDDREGLVEGLEHLQTAAKELIRAGRSLLDAMEGLVDDPAALQDVLGTIGGLAQAAASRLGLDGEGASADDGDDGKVQRIKLS